MNETSGMCAHCVKSSPWGLVRIVTALLLMLSTLSVARDYYVAPYGNDSNSGQSKEQAWATLPHACESVTASAEDPAVMYLAPHEYGDGPYYAHGGVWYDGLALPAFTSIRGTNAHSTLVNYWIYTSPGNTVIEGIECPEVELLRWDELSADSTLTVRNCILSGVEGGVHLEIVASEGVRDVTQNLVVQNCFFNNCFRWQGFIDQISAECNSNGLRMTVENSCFLTPYLRSIAIWSTNNDVHPGCPREITVSNCIMASEDNRECEFLRAASADALDWLISFSNVLVVPSPSLGSGSWLSVQNSGSDIALSMSNATTLGGASFSTDAALPGLTKLSAVDSIIDDSMIAFGGRPPAISAANSCVSWPVEGEGVIHSDPMFATGALGEYYLSQADPGQAQTSPCVDSGSVLASESTVAGLTTRTDHEPDTGMLDMGFHYGRRIGPKPYMELGHDGAPICPGSDLTAYVLLKCEGTIMLADVYLAGAYGCGDQLFYLSDDGWTGSQLPWMRKAPIRDYLPDYFSFPIHFPENIPTGAYTIYLGLVDHYSGELVSLASTPVQVVPK